PRLFNQYSVILVNPERPMHVEKEAARAFMDFMTSPEGQRAIAAYTVDGQTLFNPNAIGPQ
ncbi:MAG: sulfate transporter, partial [Gammaproteobacteria bacterium]